MRFGAPGDVSVLIIVTDGHLNGDNNDVQTQIAALTARGTVILWVLTHPHGWTPTGATRVYLPHAEQFGAVVSAALCQALADH